MTFNKFNWLPNPDNEITYTNVSGKRTPEYRLSDMLKKLPNFSKLAVQRAIERIKGGVQFSSLTDMRDLEKILEDELDETRISMIENQLARLSSSQQSKE